MSYYVQHLLICCLTNAFFAFYIRKLIKKLLLESGFDRQMLSTVLKGKRNFWWYTNINRQHSLGCVYYLNMIYSTTIGITLLFSLFLGWNPYAASINLLLFVFSYIVYAIMVFFIVRKLTILHFYKPFVWLDMLNIGWFSTPLAWLAGIFPFLFIGADISCYIESGVWTSIFAS